MTVQALKRTFGSCATGPPYPGLVNDNENGAAEAAAA